ncbi:class I SAM-dependent methyltransferase [Dokdonella sp. MW10]|uniref:class I SAM-dependent methyltransferase n=1 Tax=Dokdonella sp. MW10 TaxID=2992926 RepID=UPI003F7F5236
MDIRDIARQARAFGNQLDEKKQALSPDFGWYPYGTLTNFDHLDRLLTGANRDLLALAGGAPVADIGAADGDSAFFLESLGLDAHVIDYSPTNFNGCRGVKLIKEHLASSVSIHEVDLDARFDLPGERYGLAFFLGIFYHLKNPYNALESLARLARHAVLSTRITRYNVVPSARGAGGVNPERVELRSIPAAYLVAPTETNNDPTNYWIFSEQGLRRIIDRTGWDVLDFVTVGDTRNSDPASQQGDERAFCLLRSRVLAGTP